MNNYVCYHLHSDLSNGVTNVDSVTKYKDYIEKAKEYGMKALCFTEHGNLFEWYNKKIAIESAGMKYMHGVEAYVTETLDDKIRDNMHIVLIARNYNGFLELNSLISDSFNRTDNHFYYVPRISIEELENTSDNILVTSACIGGILGKGNADICTRFIEFLSLNKHRCFLEIGHHIDSRQIEYNNVLFGLSDDIDVPLIAGTDTHALNDQHVYGRSILQKSKGIYFDGEDNWDLRFKSLEELIDAYRKQDSLPEKVYMAAIENTNHLADMVEEFALDCGTKYPHIYDEPEKVFYEKVKTAEEEHPYALKNHSKEELDRVIDEEFEIYKATKSIDFMLLQTYLREWEQANGIECGYGRGSVSGSMIAYILGITQMDSMKFGLNFFRFMNPSRVTNADIDTDYSGADRDRVKEFLLRDKMNIPTIQSSEIITFNTIAMKGAVRDVCRAMYKGTDKDYMAISTEINNTLDNKDGEKRMRSKYPDVFEVVDIVNGTIVSVGTHPSGVLISDKNIKELIGLCSSSTSQYPISMLNMKELDALMYVKLDILGLDNIGVINDTCKMLGIERLNPDNTDLDDEDVWKSIRDNTTLIFQWESESAQKYLRNFMSDKTIKIAREHNPNFSYMKWFSFGNGLLRPGCASFRNDVARGDICVTGFKELDDFLSVTSGRITMQEDIMRFLVLFCGYSDAESDTVRRGIAKKVGTEQFIDEIHDRFVNYSNDKYGVEIDMLEDIFPPIKQGILDATNYAFSWNHSDAYSCIGYICGYLRYYYPYEFLTAALNIFTDDSDKTAEITRYADRIGVKVTMPKWGISKDIYYYDKEKNVITKNLTSVKFISSSVANELYYLSKRLQNSSFIDVLYALQSTETKINSKQLDILIKIDFFSEFGNQRELLTITDLFNNLFKQGDAKRISKQKAEAYGLTDIISKYAIGVNKNGTPAKSYVLLDVESIIRESEEKVFSVGMPDLSSEVKARNFKEAMGYVGYISGKDEDLRKLYVVTVSELRRKRDGKRFGYNVITKSIGSGKTAQFTLYNEGYKRKPLVKDDIINLKSWRREGKFFRLDNYDRINIG